MIAAISMCIGGERREKVDDESPKLLLDCAYLPYILSLLDTGDVFRCMRVCRSLYDVIKDNYHMMKKPRGSLTVTHDGQQYRENIRICHLEAITTTWTLPLCCIAFEAVLHTNGNVTSTTINASKRNNGITVPTPFLHLINQTSVLRTEEWAQNLLDLIVSRFDLCQVQIHSSPRPKIPYIQEVIKKCEVKSAECSIQSTLDWEIPVLLGSKKVNVNLQDAVMSQEHLHLLRLDTASVLISPWLWNRLDPLQRILNEWDRGEREIFDLCIEDVRPRVMETALRLVNSFNVQYMNSRNDHVHEGEIKRIKETSYLSVSIDTVISRISIQQK